MSLSFPDELFELILASFDISTITDHSGPRSLARCAQVSKGLNAIAYQSLLWKPHYESRWLHSDPQHEADRMFQYCRQAEDYRQMYRDRLVKDFRALRSLAEITAADEMLVMQNAAAVISNELGYDVIDIISSVAGLSVFSEEQVIGGNLSDLATGTLSLTDALTRQYWAKTVKGMIFRRIGLLRWISLFQPTSLPQSFESMMVTYSALYEEDPFEVTHFSSRQSPLLMRLLLLAHKSIQTSGRRM